MAGPVLGVRDRSGAVIVLMPEVGLVEINLRSKESRVISQKFRDVDGSQHFQMCFHETDFSTVIRKMK